MNSLFKACVMSAIIMSPIFAIMIIKSISMRIKFFLFIHSKEFKVVNWLSFVNGLLFEKIGDGDQDIYMRWDINAITENDMECKEEEYVQAYIEAFGTDEEFHTIKEVKNDTR